jgi:hypothetical protein
MTSTADFRMQPVEVTEATKQLHELANRIEKLMNTEAPNLTVIAPGRDEVSQRVASTMNEVHAAFSKSTDQGIVEIREVAATLRAHTDNVVTADQEFVV